jgi:hypothetical protein
MAAVADPPVDTLVLKPRPEKMFASRRESLRLVVQAEYPNFGPQGQKIGTVSGGLRLAFTDGVLRVPLEGDVVTENGKRLPAADVLTWLERHPLLGSRDEGFFEVAQVAPPVSEAEVEAITEAAMLHDTDALTRILDAERAGWQRPALIRNVEKRLEQIAQMAADYAAQIEAQAGEPAAKAAPKKAAR